MPDDAAKGWLDPKIAAAVGSALAALILALAGNVQGCQQRERQAEVSGNFEGLADLVVNLEERQTATDSVVGRMRLDLARIKRRQRGTMAVIETLRVTVVEKKKSIWTRLLGHNDK